jgi:hypothetical protein
MRRRALLWLAGLALVVGALFLTDRLLWQPGLTEDNVRRIRPGMTLAEVEALLDGPATVTVDMRPVAPDEESGYRWLRRWKVAGAAVDVQFAADGPVTAAAGRGRPQPGPLARLRAWLG